MIKPWTRLTLVPAPSADRKVRCDSAKPACDGCVKLGTPQECVYLPRQKPGLKTGFNTGLLERVGCVLSLERPVCI